MSHHIEDTTSWTSEDLGRIDASEELRIASLRAGGTLRNPVTVWVVRDDGDLYVRSVNGPTATWFRGTRDRHQRRIWAGGVEKSVSFEADITHRDSIVAAADRVQRELSGADILVNNAGVMLLAPFSSDEVADPSGTDCRCDGECG